MTQLLLTPAALAAIREACEQAHPREACGLLLGIEAETGDIQRHVTAIVTGRNLEPSPHRFLLDPADFLRADSRALELGLEIVGSFHSHPDRPACPSLADEAAAEPGWSHVIASVVRGRCVEVRSWGRQPDSRDARLAEEVVRVGLDADEPAPARRSA